MNIINLHKHLFFILKKSNPFASMLGNNFDIEGLISNPAVMNMAQRFISDSNAQNFFGQMVNSLGGNGSASGGSGSATASGPGGFGGLGGGLSGPSSESNSENAAASGGDNDFMQFLRAYVFQFFIDYI